MSLSLALLVLDVVVAKWNVDLKEVLDTVLASRMGEPPMTIGPDGDDDDGNGVLMVVIAMVLPCCFIYTI